MKVRIEYSGWSMLAGDSKGWQLVEPTTFGGMEGGRDAALHLTHHMTHLPDGPTNGATGLAAQKFSTRHQVHSPRHKFEFSQQLP